MKLVKGKKALLIAEACKLNKEKKTMEKRIAEIKKELKIFPTGEYSNEAGDTLVVSEAEKWSDIDSHLLFKHMKSEKMLKYFWSCVKAQVTCVKKHIPESRYNQMRRPLDPIQKWSWK